MKPLNHPPLGLSDSATWGGTGRLFSPLTLGAPLFQQGRSRCLVWLNLRTTSGAVPAQMDHLYLFTRDHSRFGFVENHFKGSPCHRCQLLRSLSFRLIRIGFSLAQLDVYMYPVDGRNSRDRQHPQVIITSWCCGRMRLGDVNRGLSAGGSAFSPADASPFADIDDPVGWNGDGTILVGQGGGRLVDEC